MLKIFLGNEGIREIYLPINTESRILYGNTSISFRVIVIVTFILEDCNVAENSKPMGETSGYE